MTDFTDYRVGDKVGIRYSTSYRQSETVIGEIADETKTLWIVTYTNSRGYSIIQKFKKNTGVQFPIETGRVRDNLHLCSEQEALNILEKYNERVDREYCQQKANDLKCVYSESFQNDFLALIEKHKRTN